MHHQIKQVCQSLRFLPAGEVRVCLTAGERTPLGRIVGKMYYQTDLVDLLGSRTVGHPHNGGQHSFLYIGRRGDAVAFLELLKETALEKFRLDEEGCQVASELSFISQDILAAR
jgi:hypothetical protein